MTDHLAPFEFNKFQDEEMPQISLEEFEMEDVQNDTKTTINTEANNSRHSTPIYQMIERIENKIKAEEHQRQFGFDDLIEKIQKTSKLSDTSSTGNPIDDLWVNKYRPQKFTQLITMDSCNLEVLRWVKQWDFAKDLIMGKSKAEVLQNVDENRRKTFKGKNKNSQVFDYFDRPDRKILLIHGPPGLGKTTLAHIVAQTAGYSVIEINASDERVGNSVITKISSAIGVKTSFTSDLKPTMIVIDEIDGAAAAGNENNLIKYLVKLATSKAKVSKKTSKSTTTVNKSIDEHSDSDDGNDEELNPQNPSVFSINSSKATRKTPSSGTDYGLLHPIICICNDLFVPALRPLRQIAHILHIKTIGPVQLSLRLKAICDREGLRINARTLVDLAEVMDSDVRSTLNALQFLHKKSLVGNATNFNRELTFGAFKDTVKPPMKIYDSIFHNSTSNNSIKNSDVHNHRLTGNSGRKYSELLEMVWSCGLESDKLMNGLFEIYPTIKFFDNSTMDRVNSALELFSSFDLMAHHNQNGRLDNYLNYKLCGLKGLFSSPVHSSFKYPKEDYENFLLNTEYKAIYRDYLSSLPVKVKSECYKRDYLITDRIPAVLNSALSQFSNIKSSNPQLMRPEDKQKITKIVEILLSEGINLRQIKITDSASYKFVLDPPIDRMSLDHLTCPTNSSLFSKLFDNETVQDSHTYSLCRVVAAEMESLRIKKQKSKQASAADASTNSTETSSASTPVKRRAIDIRQAVLPEKAKKLVARDFFGRPVVLPDDHANGTSSTSQSKMNLWYVQNDGVSNAVRRNIKIGAFLN